MRVWLKCLSRVILASIFFTSLGPKTPLPPQPLTGSFQLFVTDSDPIDFSLAQTANKGGSIACTAQGSGTGSMTLSLLRNGSVITSTTAPFGTISIETEEPVDQVFWFYGFNSNIDVRCDWNFFAYALYFPDVSK